MKKKTKVSKKKLDSLLLVLLLTAVLLIMSTYAWFTANRTVSIGNLDVRIETQSGLQISADAEDWKTVLELKDLQDATQKYKENIVNQLPVVMEPVSTVLEKNGNSMKMFYGVTEPESETSTNFVITSTEETEKAYDGTESPAGRYIAFDIYLKSGNAEKDLYMSGNVVELELNNPDKVIEDPTKEKGITNASRIAIIPGDNKKSEDAEDLRATLKTGGTPMMWEPNNDYHTSKAIVYDEKTVGWNHGLREGAGNSEIAYDGVKAPITLAEGILLGDGTATAHSDKFAPVHKTWSTSKNDTSTSDLVMPKNATTPSGESAALAAGVTKYRVYMWIEGQDIDCENYASGSRARYTLNFSLDSAGTQVNPK